MLTKIVVQIVGQCLVAGAAFYWLGLGVGSTTQVALNVLGGVLLLLAWAALDAYGLGRWRNVLWAIPAVLVLGLLLWKWSAAPLVALAWLAVLLPSAAQGRWMLFAKPRYLAMGFAILVLSSLPAIALLGWTPRVSGMAPELASFGLRTIFAAIFLFGGWAILLDFVRRQTAAPIAEQGLPPLAPAEPLHS
ncbi:MAG: hypothetical protein OHK0021_06560 [Bryobacter sp.]